MRVALAHDYLIQLGGAERVLAELCAMFPQAPIFTLLYDEEATQGRFADREVVTSFLQRIPGAKRHHRMFPAFMPAAAEHLHIDGFDLVLSDSAGFAKGIIVPPWTKHVSFCHTPLRYAWDDSHRYLEEFQAFPQVLKFAAPFALTYIRLWDYAAAQRPDALLANSRHVRRRIRKYYGREAEVVYPPVRVSFFSRAKRRAGDAWLMVGRLLAYKRFDVGIAATAKAKVPLRIVGDGPEYKNLKRIAGPHVTFLGAVDDETLREEFATCRALLFPQEEDFGIVAVEALAAGAPVVAFAAGGAAEIVEDGVTGMLVSEQTPEAFAAAIRSFRESQFAPRQLRARAERFDTLVFRKKIEDIAARHVSNL